MNQSSYVAHTGVWTAVVELAVESLDVDIFPLWLMAVGVMGTDEERAEKGDDLIRVFTGYQLRRNQQVASRQLAK